ncbi:DUF6261 family protein [Marinifilum flexuosum]|uniref:Uncharacterized protein n=1 Tax=Marinifilum flexuosum TaxID=1117708 RepID=A0A419X2T7_9BACT|nr:DUF6261 family protein [Marinifilum flexuosum]RKE02054.1 hypothetical protein BXY64_2135 [Marinifilum flexuosum]
MYQKINFHNLQNMELILFIKSFIEIIAKADPELLKVKAQYDALLAIFTEMDTFYNPELANKLTKLIQELDGKRDQALSGIIDVLEAYLKHYDPATKLAAESLLHSIDNYGDQIGNYNYIKETGTIRSMCTRWKNVDELTQALTKLNLTAWTNKLEEFNTQFDAQYMERNELDAKSPDITMVEYRKQSYEAYKAVLKYMEANALLNGVEPYTEVNKSINQTIEKYNLVIKTRISKKDETEVPEESTSVD